MNKPILWAAGTLLLAGIGTAGGVYVASSGGEQEVVQEVATTTAVPSASGSPSATTTTSLSPTVSASARPSATPPPLENWATYSVPEAGLTLRYPPAWYALKDGGIHSWNPSGWTSPYIPPESVSIDVIYGPSENAEPRPTGAADFSIAAGSGWEITYPRNPAIDDGLTRVHQIAIEKGKFTLFIIASYSQANPDEGTFSQIVNSLQFAE